MLIDFAVMAVPTFVIAFIVGFSMAASDPTVDQEALQAAGQLVGVVSWWLYLAVLESSVKQATLGKMALGIKVVDEQGKRISFGRATGRHFGKFVSAIILGIGFLMAAFTSKKQGLHDMMANCLVVEKDGLHNPATRERPASLRN